jgi:hypothetical protein
MNNSKQLWQIFLSSVGGIFVMFGGYNLNLTERSLDTSFPNNKVKVAVLSDTFPSNAFVEQEIQTRTTWGEIADKYDLTEALIVLSYKCTNGGTRDFSRIQSEVVNAKSKIKLLLEPDGCPK